MFTKLLAIGAALLLIAGAAGAIADDITKEPPGSVYTMPNSQYLLNISPHNILTIRSETGAEIHIACSDEHQQVESCRADFIVQAGVGTRFTCHNTALCRAHAVKP